MPRVDASAAIVMAGLLIGCSVSTPVPITPTPTLAPTPTDTEEPTPTDTPSPTATVTPTPLAVRTVKIGNKPVSVVMDPSGRQVYVADEVGVIHVVSTAGLRVANEIKIGNPTLSWLTISPRGDRLFATTLDGSVFVIDTTRAEIVTRASLDSPLPVYRPMTLAADSGRLYIANSLSKSPEMIAFEAQGLGLIGRFGDARDPRLAAINRAGNRLYVPSYLDGMVNVYSILPTQQTAPTLTSQVPINGGPTAANLNRDESQLYVSLGIDPGIAVVNTRTLRVEKMIQVPTTIFAAITSPDGRRLVATSNISDYAYVIDTAKNQMLEAFFIGQGPRGVAISPDGRRAYTANFLDGTISVFDLP